MRRFALTAVVLYVAALTACASPAKTAFGPSPMVPMLPGAAAAPAPARGAILSMKFVTTITKAQMDAGLAGQVISEIGGKALCDVDLYSITYATIGVRGEYADAGTAFFVPRAGCPQTPHLLVAYAQGTNVVREQSIAHPQRKNPEPTIVAAIFAAHGYAVTATDYLGLGASTYPYPPYVEVDAESSAVIDSIRAARNAAHALNVALSGDVYLTGHSQGGQASLATQRAIEAQFPQEFHVIADVPSSGPYDLTRTAVDGVLHPGQNAPILATYILTAYQHAYGNVYRDPLQAFQDPYANWVDSLIPVATYADGNQLFGRTLPRSMDRLLQPAFARRFVHDPGMGARIDVAKNDLLKGWKPVAPLYLCGGDRDPQVEYVNSELAYAFFHREGATVSLTDVNDLMPKQIHRDLYHDAVLVLCLAVMRVSVLDRRSAPR